MKTIKIIELLNKIANGEDVPKKVYYKDIIFEYDNLEKCYIYQNEDYSIVNDISMYFSDGICANSLNEEIEIIEDDEKKIEKLPLKTPCILPNRTNTEISHIPDNLELTVKINEVIDYINNLGKNK